MNADELVKAYFADRINHFYSDSDLRVYDPITADNIVKVYTQITDGSYGSDDSPTWWPGDRDIVVEYRRPSSKGKGRTRTYTVDLSDLPEVLAEIAEFATKQERKEWAELP